MIAILPWLNFNPGFGVFFLYQFKVLVNEDIDRIM